MIDQRDFAGGNFAEHFGAVDRQLRIALNASANQVLRVGPVWSIVCSWMHFLRMRQFGGSWCGPRRSANVAAAKSADSGVADCSRCQPKSGKISDFCGIFRCPETRGVDHIACRGAFFNSSPMPLRLNAERLIQAQ